MTIRSVLLLSLIFLLTCCQDDDDQLLRDKFDEPDVVGLNFVRVEAGAVDSIYSDLLTSFSSNSKIGVVAEVDHADNAASVGVNLRATRVVLFGNPRLGTPLMQINPQAGLDLPQKMLVYTPDAAQVVVAYNNTEYLARRHGVEGASTLPTITNALRNFAENATGATVVAATNSEVRQNEGVTNYRGTGTVDSVYAKLRGEVTGNPNLALVAELDHQANAASVGLELPAIRLLVFGNPSLGTPLLQEKQSIGIDLPQKMLVYDAGNGEVVVAFNDPFYLASRHALPQDLPELTTVRNALSTLAQSALAK